MGRGDHAHVDPAVLVFAHPAHGAGLQHAQQLGLQLQGQLADLVEEDGAAVGLEEGAVAIADRAGEGAAHVAEQLALDQVGATEPQSTTTKGRVPRLRLGVDGLGHHFLAGAGLTQQQHRGVGRGHLVEDAEELLHRLRRADGRAEDGLLLGLAQVGFDHAHLEGGLAQAQRGLVFDDHLGDARAAQVRAVGRLEILHPHAVGPAR